MIHNVLSLLKKIQNGLKKKNLKQILQIFPLEMKEQFSEYTKPH